MIDPEMLLPTPTTVKTAGRLVVQPLVAVPVTVMMPDCGSLTTPTFDHDNSVNSMAAAGRHIVAAAMTKMADLADNFVRLKRIAPTSQKCRTEASKRALQYRRGSF